MEKHLFRVDKNLFPRTVVLRACHAFLDECPVEIEFGDEKYWHVFFHLQEEGVQEKEPLEGEFRNALVNEAFRDSLMERAQATKELIIAKALFGVDGETVSQSIASPASVEPLSDLDEELDDYEADPLGIAVPWEEKYGTDRGKDNSGDDQETPQPSTGDAS